MPATLTYFVEALFISRGTISRLRSLGWSWRTSDRSQGQENTDRWPRHWRHRVCFDTWQSFAPTETRVVGWAWSPFCSSTLSNGLVAGLAKVTACAVCSRWYRYDGVRPPARFQFELLGLIDIREDLAADNVWLKLDDALHFVLELDGNHEDDDWFFGDLIDVNLRLVNGHLQSWLRREQALKVHLIKGLSTGI